MYKIILKSDKQPIDQTGHRQNTKQLPNDYTVDEYVTELKQSLNERNSAKLIQNFDDKIIKYIVYID